MNYFQNLTYNDDDDDDDDDDDFIPPPNGTNLSPLSKR
jgi:hypothetical protein